MKKRIISVLMAAVMLLSLAPTAQAQAGVAPSDGNRQQAYLQAAVSPSVPSGEKDAILPTPGTVGKDGMIEIADQTEMFSVPISETDYYNILRQGKEELSLSSHIHSHVQPASRQFNMRANYTLPSNWTAEANIPRWKWLQNLEVVFDLYAEAEDYPDNYYTDLSEGDAYYDVIMIAVSHGLLEEEAGDPVNPTAPATRDFAAHTLSFCLGSIPEKDSFDFSDSAASQWPEDAQVAVERGWLVLSGGKFLPGNQLTAEEVSTMLADAEATLADRDVSQESSQYRLADWVIKLPDTVTVTANWDENFNQSLTIEGYTGTLNAGDTFAYEEDGFPMVYGVASVSQNGNSFTVVTQDAPEGALLEAEYVGSVTPELKPMLLSNTAVQFDTHEYGTVTAGKIFAAKGNGKSSISFSRDLSIMDGLKGNLKAEVKDIKIEKKFIGENRYFVLTGQLVYSASIKLTVAKKSVNIPMGGVSVGSLGYVGLELQLKVDASIGIQSTQKFRVGLDFQGGRPSWIRETSPKSFALTVDGKASLTFGITGRLDFGAFGDATARLSIGPEGKASYKRYESGQPKDCLTLSAYLYAGLKLNVELLKPLTKGVIFSYDYSYDFWNEKNSPYRLYEHREDGLVVTECTRGKEAPSSTSGDPAPRAASKFTTPATSRRFSTSSKIANSTGKNNRGEVVVIWETKEQSDGTVWITGYNGNAVFLTIPETIDGKTVSGIGYNVFYNRTEIQYIDIPDSVTEIQSQAFANTGLQSLKLPSQLETLGSRILEGTTGVKDLKIPKTVVKAGSDYANGALRGSHVETLSFEEGITVVPNYIATGATNLKSVTLPGTVTEIGYAAFRNCSALTTINIPDSVTTIGGGAFDGCSSLSEISLPDSVTEIQSQAFANTGLQSLKLPSQLETLGSRILEGTTGVKDLKIPKTVVKAGSDYANGALRGSHVETLSFEEGITVVPHYIATGATNLKSVTLPGIVTEIGYSAFRNCSALTTINIPDSVTTIRGNAFDGCSSLSKISLPDSVTEIQSQAFENTGLQSLSIPGSVATMGSGILSGCEKLESVEFKNTPSFIPESMFYNCSSLKKVTLPDSVTEIRKNAFAYCGSLESVILGENVSVIREGAFSDCTTLATINLPEGLSQIGPRAFKNCDSLTSVNLPATVTKVEGSAFYDCDALKEVTLNTGITEIPASCFEHCDSLESIVVPYRVTKIGSKAFKDCVKFTGITIPRATTNIASDSFSYKNKLTIYGISGTYAETYANSNSIKFVIQEVPATKVTLSETALTMNKGTSATLTMSVTPENFTDAVSWKSSDTAVATVTEAGVVKAVGLGITTIKLTVGNVSASCTVTVGQPVTSVSISRSSLSLEALESFTLTATANPNNAGNREISWSSSDGSVATVDQNGLVKALKKGTVTITAAAQDGSGKTANCKVTVTNNVVISNTASGLESPHNYENNCRDVWVYQNPGAESVSLTFDEQTMMEDGFDYLYIYDASGKEVGKYTGAQLAGQTVTVAGDTTKIKLVSDDGGNAWGFKVTEAFSTIAGVTTPSDKDMKEAAAITAENTDVVMEVEEKEEAPKEADVDQICGKTGLNESDFGVVSGHDITMHSVQYDGEGSEIPGSRKPITQLKSAVTLTFITPGEAGVTYLVVRVHVDEKGNVEITILPTTDNGDGTVSVESDKFSMFYLLEVKDSSYTPGDINGDGKVNIFDVIRLLKKVTGEKVETFAGTDVNGDGKVNIFDVIRLLKFVTGEKVEVH